MEHLKLSQFIYAISYLLFASILLLSKAKQGLRLVDNKGLVSSQGMLILLHLAGIVLFSIPFFLQQPSSFDLFKGASLRQTSTLVSLSCLVLIFYISLQISKRKYEKLFANSLVRKSPGSTYIIFYFILRILFISVYEIWFRGFLFNDSIIVLGPVLAILLNTILYMLLHIVNGRDEVIACIPFGILLCCLCLWQGAVWPAIMLHLVLTIPYEVYFLRNIKINNLNDQENINNRSFGLSR